MSPTEVKFARHTLGMTQDQLAKILRMGTDGKRAIRRWEAGDREISGPASVAIQALLDGWRPDSCTEPASGVKGTHQTENGN
jgi:DNA-binding transcriptional regulator YiaG